MEERDRPGMKLKRNEPRSAFQDGSLGSLASTGVAPRAVDVCVVGAGVAGLSAAHRLAIEGRTVLVLDARPLGCGETGLSTAHLSTALDGFQRLLRLHGADRLRLAVEGHAQAIDQIERTIAAESIECGFERVDGYLVLDPERGDRYLEREFEAARRAGLDVDLHGKPPVPTLSPGPALRFARQAQLDPARYLAGLARAATSRGVMILTGARVDSVEGGDRCKVVLVDGQVIRARAVVVATNAPISELARLHTKQAPYRSYAVTLEVERDAYPRALYWDTATPYHYVRLAGGDPRSSTDLLIVGGEDHRTGADDLPEARWEALVDWAGPRFPAAGRVRHRWSGQILESVDGLAFIGPSPDGERNVYVVTGDSGHGMTYAAIAAGLLSNLIQGRLDPYAALYDPRRWSLRALPAWTRENLTTAGHYLEWARVGPAQGEVLLAPGEGVVVRRGLKRLAIARDDAGEYHVRSAACTHLGGLVHWNAAERSWDCPCHGSRFDVCGVPLNGPATRDLEPVALADAPALGAPSPAPQRAEAGVDVAAARRAAHAAVEASSPPADAPAASFAGQRQDVAGSGPRAQEAHAAQGERPARLRPTIEPPRLIPFSGVAGRPSDEDTEDMERAATERLEFSVVETIDLEAWGSPGDFEAEMPSFASVGARLEGLDPDDGEDDADAATSGAADDAASSARPSDDPGPRRPRAR